MIDAEDVGVRRGGRAVLLVDELTVDRELVAIMGPNGAGKTTLLEALAGEIEHTGEIRADESWLVREAPPERVLVEVADLVRSHGTDNPQRFLDELAYDGPRQLAHGSAGERMLAGLAGALARDEDLLLDEPFSHLDPPHVARLTPALRDRGDDRAIVFTTHDARAAAQADRVLLLSNTVVARGEPREVLQPSQLSECYGAPVDVEWTRLGPIVAGLNPDDELD